MRCLFQFSNETFFAERSREPNEVQLTSSLVYSVLMVQKTKTNGRGTPKFINIKGHELVGKRDSLPGSSAKFAMDP